MSEDFFRVYRGLELDDASQFLTGTVPPGSSTNTDAAPRGSYYTNQNDGSLWMKISSGVGTVRWSQMATQSYVQSLAVVGTTWKPAVVVAASDTTLPLGTANTPIVIDGVTVTNGQHVLFNELLSTPDIYSYDRVTGTFSLVDPSGVTAGDTTYVTSGSDAGKTLTFNGSLWVITDAATTQEDAYIRTFIGKSGIGSITPTYSSTNVVTNGTSLEAAIAQLDTETGYENAFIGKTAGNHLPAYTSNNFVANNDSLQVAIGKLDTELGSNLISGTVVLSTAGVNANIKALDNEVASVDTFLGKIVGTGTPNYTSITYLSQGQSVTAAVSALDAALAQTDLKVVASGVSTIQAVDKITGAMVAEWDVVVTDASNPLNVYACKVFAAQNGAIADFTKFSVLKLGAAIPAVVVDVTLVGSALVLTVGAGINVNVVSKRLSSIV